jgi:predicted ester cyclase
MEAATETLAAPPAPAADAPPIEIVRWAIDVINTHDVTPLKPYWESTVEYFPGLTAHGADEIAAYFEDTFAAMPDFHIEIMGIAADGENVLMRWRATGNFTGESFQGITATGHPVVIDGHDHFVIRDGQIISNNVAYDRLDYAQQIGLLPPDDTAVDRVLKSAFNLKTKAFAAIKRN